MDSCSFSPNKACLFLKIDKPSWDCNFQKFGTKPIGTFVPIGLVNLKYKQTLLELELLNPIGTRTIIF